MNGREHTYTAELEDRITALMVQRDRMQKAIELASEAIDLALNWGPKTQSDEYLIETRLKEALAALNGAK